MLLVSQEWVCDAHEGILYYPDKVFLHTLLIFTMNMKVLIFTIHNMMKRDLYQYNNPKHKHTSSFVVNVCNLWNKTTHTLGCQDEGLRKKMKAMKHLGEKRKDWSYKGQQKGNQLPQLWPYVTKVMFHEIDPSLNICQHLGFQSLSWLFACWSGHGWKSVSRRYKLLRKENMHLFFPPYFKLC